MADVSGSYRSEAQRSGWSTLIGTTLFTLPFLLIVLADIFVLNRQPIDHLGDYSGIFSLGLGWLEQQPYIFFAWPAWTFGQISALAILFAGYRPTDLTWFYNFWAVLNFVMVIYSGLILACFLRDRRLPFWSALIFGLVTASIPMVTTGLSHSNPYPFLLALLVPGIAVLVFRLGEMTGRALAKYEILALAGLGFALANNFGVLVLLLAAALALLIARPEIVAGLFSRPFIRLPRSSPAEIGFVIGATIFVTSVLVGIVLRLRLPDQTFPSLWEAETSLMLVLYIFCAVAAGTMVIFSLRALPNGIVAALAAIFIGFVISGNSVVLQYGPAALSAGGDYARPSMVSLVPVIDWLQIKNGTVWYSLLPLVYAIGWILLIVGFIKPTSSEKRIMRAGGVFAVCVIWTIHALPGWSMQFPTTYVPEQFGISYRYLWLGGTAVTAVFTALLVTGTGWKRSALTLVLIVPFWGWAFAQSIDAKRVIVHGIQVTLTDTDAAIDQHLAASPDNLVLVANAYYPQRAQLLYAYHNSLRGVPAGAVETLEGARIRYIGRFGGSLWQSPMDIIRQNNLAPENILLIGEIADYPDYIVEVKRFPLTSVIIGRIVADALTRAP